jgi:hypothetical protein
LSALQVSEIAWFVFAHSDSKVTQISPKHFPPCMPHDAPALFNMHVFALQQAPEVHSWSGLPQREMSMGSVFIISFLLGSFADCPASLAECSASVASLLLPDDEYETAQCGAGMTGSASVPTEKPLLSPHSKSKYCEALKHSSID